MKRILRLAFQVTTLLSLPGLASPVWPPRTFSAYYASIEADTPDKLASFDLLILHPGEDGKNLDKDKLSRLRRAGVEKTIVGYISIGEESVSPGGPPLQGQDGSGPSFVGKDLKVGLAGRGYPAYFLDQKRFVFDEDGWPKRSPNGSFLQESGQDGHPDENGVWGSYYVKADDPLWRAKVFERLEQLDRLGLDGFFLDTVDTASPWGSYGWTSAGMLELVEAIRARYPNKRIVANRGLFYLGQGDRYAKAIDAVMFESLLTSYSEQTKSAQVSAWSRWHVQALEDDVIPAQKRTGLALLVLDYLDPEHADAPLLVQSLRTLLEGAPNYAVSFSHPSLRIPGWTLDELLPEKAPHEWPSVTGIKTVEEAKGSATIEILFDGPVPEGAVPDLRLTTRDDLLARRAAELPLANVESFRVQGHRLILVTCGLDKATNYRLFFRLISRSHSPQSPFAWTILSTAAKELPGQVQELGAQSCPDGVHLSFQPLSSAKLYRVYSIDDSGRQTLIEQTESSPVLLSGLTVGQAVTVCVTAVDGAGREGYPSRPLIAIRRSLLPPPAPGAVSISGNTQLTRLSWSPVEGAQSYRLYVIPQGDDYRIPVLCKEAEAVILAPQKGVYRVFVAALDKDGNQSERGPSLEWVVD